MQFGDNSELLFILSRIILLAELPTIAKKALKCFFKCAFNSFSVLEVPLNSVCEALQFNKV